jgi:hypothetical protein
MGIGRPEAGGEPGDDIAITRSTRWQWEGYLLAVLEVFYGDLKLVAAGTRVGEHLRERGSAKVEASGGGGRGEKG